MQSNKWVCTYIQWGGEKRIPSAGPDLGKGEHALTLHYVQSKSRRWTLTHSQLGRVQERQVQIPESLHKGDGDRRQRNTQEHRENNKRLNRATLTLVSTTLQWGTPCQPGLKFGWCLSAVRSHRCVCVGVKIRWPLVNRHHTPGHPLVDHDSLGFDFL